jgi:hypothetical protein
MPKLLQAVPLILVLVGSGAGCPRPGATATPATSPPGPRWAAMAKEARQEHMKTVIVPRMAGVLGAFDAKKFAQVNCITCHGEGAKRGEFAMPSASLPALTIAGQFAKHDKKWVEFMAKTVVPAMVAALPGVERWSPQNPKGFGCGSCHVMR